MTLSERGRRTLTVWLVAALLLTAIAPSVASAVSTDGTSLLSDIRPSAQQDSPSSANNTTIRHRNPEEVNAEDEIAGIRRQLIRQAAAQVRRGNVELSQEDYEQAQEVLGDDYQRIVEQYSTVDEGEASSTLVRLRRARQLQEVYFEAVREYRSTVGAYRVASGPSDRWPVDPFENGSTRRERVIELARELERLETRVNATGTELVEEYGNLSETAGVNFTATETIRNVTAEIRAQQAQIRDEVFVETTLFVRADGAHVSFRDPLEIRGLLTAENGSVLANRTVEFRIGNRTLNATTDASGRFDLSYRPVGLRLNASHVTLRYEPANTSVYLGDTSRLPVIVTQVEPTITVVNASASAAYAESVFAVGRIGVDGVGIDDAPLRVSIGGVPIDRLDSIHGTFAFEGSLPADVPAGEQSLRVTLPFEDRALAGTNVTVPVDVERTATTLTISGETVGERAIEVSGVMRTRDGEVVSNRALAIEVNGTLLSTAQTNANGRYSTVVSVSEAVASGERVSVRVVFDGSGTNLGESSAVATARLQAGSGPGGTPFDVRVPLWAWIGLAGIVVLALTGFYRVSEWRPGGRDERSDEFESGSSGDAGGVGEETDATEEVLDRIRSEIDAERPNEAVEVGYEILRSRLSDSLGIATRRTHWEFYTACRDAGVEEDRLRALQRVTEFYERAAFAADAISMETARDALGAMGDVLRTERDERATSSDD